MTREFIEQLDTIEPYCYETDKEEIWYKVGLIHGLEIADAEPNFEKVWHDASEEPQGKYEIICQDEFENVWLTDYSKDEEHHENGWKECVECECIVRWAYISSLLPKGGKK